MEHLADEGSPGLVPLAQAVSTPIQDSSMSTETSSSGLSIPKGQPTVMHSYEYHQAVHNIDARNVTVQDNQTLQFTDARVVNLLDASPLVVAQAHQMVADARDQALQYVSQFEVNAKSQALQFAKTAEANANSQAMQYACVAKAQAQSQINALENQFQSQVQAIEAEASDRIRQSLDEATMRVTQSQEEYSRVVQNAQREVVNSQGQIEHLKKLLAERSQQIVHVAGALQEKHEALVITQNKMVEMQSQMDVMMNQIKDQNNMIRALQVQKTDPAKFQALQVEANAKNEALQFEVNAKNEALQFEAQAKRNPIMDLRCPPKLGESSSSSSVPKSSVQPMPCTSIPESFAVSPIVRSIATPRSSHPGTEFPVGPTGQSQCAVPRASGFYGEELRTAPSPGQCSGELHLAPPMLPPEILRNWQVGNQIQGDQNMALSIQVQQLANQVQTIANEINSQRSNRHGRRPPSNESDQRPRVPQSPPGSGPSSSSSSSRSKKGGRGKPGRERATVRSRIPFRRWCFQHWFKRRKGSI